MIEVKYGCMICRNNKLRLGLLKKIRECIAILSPKIYEKNVSFRKKTKGQSTSKNQAKNRKIVQVMKKS